MDNPISRLRRRILEVAHKSGEGHVPSALSILDIVYVLQHWVLRPPGEDFFLLSKGHGCLALYACLEEINHLPAGELDRFCQPGGLLGHPERNPSIGIEATTGSLGHGGPMSVGLAYGLRLQGSDAKVYCLLGDSECEEGSVYEAMHIAARHNLSNLHWVIDNNHTSPNDIDGERWHSGLAQKFSAFGWFVNTCDGHNHAEIRRALACEGGPWPHVVIAETVKGKGVPAMEANPQLWHRKSPTEEMLEWQPE